MLDNSSITDDPIKAKLTRFTGTKTPSDWGMTRCFCGSSNNIGIANPYVIDFSDINVAYLYQFRNNGFTVFSSKYFGHAIKFYYNSIYKNLGSIVYGNGVVFKTDMSLGCPYDYKTAAFFENIYISIHSLINQYGNSPTPEQFVSFLYDTLESMYHNDYDYKDEYKNKGKPFDIGYGISGTQLFIYSQSNTDTTVRPYPLFFIDISMKYKSNAYIDSRFASNSCYFSEDLYIIETGGEVIMSTSYEGKDCFADDIVSRSDFSGHISIGVLSDFTSYNFPSSVCNMGYLYRDYVRDSYIYEEHGYEINYSYHVIDENGYFIEETVTREEIPSTFISKEWGHHYSDRGYNAEVEFYGLHAGQLKNTYYDYVYNWSVYYTSKDLIDSDLSTYAKDQLNGNRSFFQYVDGVLLNGEGNLPYNHGTARSKHTFVPAPFPELHCEYDQEPIEFPSLEFNDEEPYVTKFFYWPIQAYKSYRNDDMVIPQKDYTSSCSRSGDTRPASVFHSYETVDDVKYHHFKITYTYFDAARGNNRYNVDYCIPYRKHKRKSKYEGEVVVTLQPSVSKIKCIAEKLKLTKWDNETNEPIIEYRDYSFSITTRASTWYPNPDTVVNKYGFPYCVKYPTEKYIVTFSEDHKYIPNEEFEVSVPTQRAIKSISASLDKNQFYLINHRLNISDSNIIDKSKSITTSNYSIKAKKVNNVWTVQDKECVWSIVDREYTTIGINYVIIKCLWKYYTDDDGNDYVEEPTCLVKVTIAQSIIGIMMWYEGPDIDLNETHYCKRSDIRVYLLYEHNAVKLIDAQGGPFRNPTIEILEDWPSDPYAEFDKSKLFINNDNRRDIYISKEGYNWIKGIFRYDDDIEFEEWFCVYAYKSKRIVDKSLKIIYIRSKTNWYYEDVTEQFEQYITRDGVTVIGWKNFLNICNKLLLSGLFKIIAPARTGLNARYASEWMVFTPNETTLIATCKEIYNKDK